MHTHCMSNAKYTEPHSVLSCDHGVITTYMYVALTFKEYLYMHNYVCILYCASLVIVAAPPYSYSKVLASLLAVSAMSLSSFTSRNIRGMLES